MIRLATIVLILVGGAFAQIQTCPQADPDEKAVCEKRNEIVRLQATVDKKLAAKKAKETQGIRCSVTGNQMTCSYLGHPEDEQVLHGKVASWIWRIEPPDQAKPLDLQGQTVTFDVSALGTYLIRLNIADVTGRYQQSFQHRGTQKTFEWEQ